MPIPELPPQGALNALIDKFTGLLTLGRFFYAGADPVAQSGLLTAAAAATIVADTGPMAAGAYRAEIFLGFSGVAAAGKHLVLEHRDATNAATLHSIALVPAPGTLQTVIERINLAANQRLRIIVGAVAAGAGEVTQGHIRTSLLPT